MDNARIHTDFPLLERDPSRTVCATKCLPDIYNTALVEYCERYVLYGKICFKLEPALNGNYLFIITFSGRKNVVGTSMQSPNCFEVEMFM